MRTGKELIESLLDVIGRGFVYDQTYERHECGYCQTYYGESNDVGDAYMTHKSDCPLGMLITEAKAFLKANHER